MKTKKNSLSTRALLVSVNISQWTGRKLDKKATDTANAAHKADASAGKYHKKLLPAAAELERVSTIASQARKFYYENTLPWFSDGTRIIASQSILNFQTQFRNIRAAFDQAVSEFIAAYPRLKSEAAARLGDLYSESEYPEDIAGKFSLTVDFLPMPDSSDFRVQVSDAEKRAFEKKIKEIEAAAMRDACGRLFDVIKAATAKLSDKKTIFRDSLFENISDMARLIPALNIANDPQLNELSEQAASLVNSIQVDQVRNNDIERETARKALADIEARMGAFMGGIK